jgi:hypothetical protein
VLTINSQVCPYLFFCVEFVTFDWLVNYQFSPMSTELLVKILLSGGDHEAATSIKKLISNSSRAKPMFRPFWKYCQVSLESISISSTVA